MANADAPFGFRPINFDGSPYNGATIRCVIPASDSIATHIGDAVDLLGGSDTGYPSVTQADAGDAVFGVVTAFEAAESDLSKQYRVAATKRFCQVAMAHNGYFEVQSDDDTTAILASDVGMNVNFVQTQAGSNVTGLSGQELNSDTVASTTTLDCQIMSLKDSPDNDLSAGVTAGSGGTNKIVIVRFNDPQTKPGRAGVT